MTQTRWLSTPDLLTVLLLVAEAMLLLHAAMRDIATRTIPDESCLVLAALGLLQRGRQHQLIGGVLAGAAVLAGALVLWRCGWFGGGDVKLVGACACLVPPATVPALLGGIAICGGVLAGAYLLAMRLLRGRPNRLPAARGRPLSRIVRLEQWRIRRHGPLPYGVAISGGVLLLMFKG